MTSKLTGLVDEPLSESEQRLRLAVETGKIGLWVWNSTDVTNAGDWSPRLKEIFGFSRGVQVTHEMFLERVHPEDRSWVNERVMGALTGENGGHYQAEYRIISVRDGSERWVTARGQAFYDAEGKPFRFIGTLMDITAEKRAANAAEEKLRNSEAYLSEAQGLSRTGSFGWKVSTGALIWSDETYRILGYQQNVIPTLDIALQRVHPDDRETVREALDQAVRDKADFDFEHRLLLPSGVIRHVHVRARASQSAGAVLQYIGAVMDVTERNRAAEALKASEHVARGQLETLTKTLVALSQESEPEHLLKHVLQMIGDELGAHSISVWELDGNTGRAQIVATCEGGGMQFAPPGKERATPRISLVTRPHPVWTDFFQTGSHCVIAEIQTTKLRVRIAEVAESPWYDWSSDTVSNPTSEALIAALHAQGIVQTLAVPTLVGGKVTGLINIRFRGQRVFRPEELELARALTHQAMLAIRLRRLSLQSRQTAIVAERNRMARDIHDTLAQGFTGVIMQLEAVQAAIKGNSVSDAAEHVQRAADLARWGLGEARRSVMALRPHSLQNGTFYMAMDEMLRRMAGSSQLQVEFNVAGEPRALSPEYEDSLLRITQEALTNTVKHAGARHFSVTLTFGFGFVQLRVTDDGNGFDPQADCEGFGLIGMRERAGELGGQLVLRSMPGQGTEVQVTLKNGTVLGSGNGGEHA